MIRIYASFPEKIKDSAFKVKNNDYIPYYITKSQKLMVADTWITHWKCMFNTVNKYHNKSLCRLSNKIVY